MPDSSDRTATHASVTEPSALSDLSTVAGEYRIALVKLAIKGAGDCQVGIVDVKVSGEALLV